MLVEAIHHMLTSHSMNSSLPSTMYMYVHSDTSLSVVLCIQLALKYISLLQSPWWHYHSIPLSFNFGFYFKHVFPQESQFSIRHQLILYILQKDVYLRGDPNSESRVQRLLVDIEHLDLSKPSIITTGALYMCMYMYAMLCIVLILISQQCKVLCMHTCRSTVKKQLT